MWAGVEKKERKRKERRVSCLFLVSIRSLTDNNTLHTGIVNTKSRSMDKINRGGVTPYPTKHLERLESQNSLIDASAQHKIRRLMDLVALKSIIVLSGRGIERTRYIENGTYRWFRHAITQSELGVAQKLSGKRIWRLAKEINNPTYLIL